MDVRIAPSSVSGKAIAPPSKSYTHRAILIGGLADTVTIRDGLDSADTRASRRAATAFGATIDDDSDLEINGCRGAPGVPSDVINCENSGTTMRLVTGIAGLVDGTTILTGDASLRTRPQGPLLAALDSLGARAESTADDGTAPLIITGPIEGGTVSMPGDVSSQYISALLLAGGLTTEGISIELETPLKSAPYVDITREVLADFGVDARQTRSGFSVAGEQAFTRKEPYSVPGDFSSISYLAAAGAVAGDPDIIIDGARPSAQGDTAIVDILASMGASIVWNQEAGELSVERSSLTGITVDVGDTPDLLPTIAAIGAIADGTTAIENCEHVRYKETDRVAAMATELAKMGASVTEQPDRLIIDGGESDLSGTRVDGYGDHRIVMALTIAALRAAGETEISGAEHVDVSFPGFFDVMADLGVAVASD